MIHVFLRHCYYSPNTALRGHDRPTWFDRTKIFMNFKETLDPELATYHVVFDSYYGSVTDTFLKDESNLSVISKGNESGSFIATLDIALDMKIPDEDIIYFLEDDYIHRPNWCQILREAFDLPISYVTLYDHRDKYESPNYKTLKSTLYHTRNAHWRTTPSTTNTYAMKAKTLREDIAIHKHYSLSAQKGVSRDHEKFIYLGKSGRILVSSVPGFSTHCDGMMSPVFDWERLLS